MTMVKPRLKLLVLVVLLLTEPALSRGPPPPTIRTNLLPQISTTQEGLLLGHGVFKQERGAVEGGSAVVFEEEGGVVEGDLKREGGAVEGRSVVVLEDGREEGRVNSARLLVSALSDALGDQGRIHGNASCAELLSGPGGAPGDAGGPEFSRELLGLVLVPVLVSAGCVPEARALVLRLYDLLGEEDTQELLLDLLALLLPGRRKGNAAHGISQRTSSHSTGASSGALASNTTHSYSPDTISSSSFSSSPSSSPPPPLSSQAERHLQALMFNIQQLARVGEREGQGGHGGQCGGWLRVNGTLLLGQTASREEEEGGLALEEAMEACESLGPECAGVAQEGSSLLGQYSAVLRQGSRVVPAPAGEGQCWIRLCVDGPAMAAVAGRIGRLRWRRGTPQWRDCVDKQEERVYSVVEWIPGVSTLYNLGTAIYYASRNCSDTAKERALLAVVDLGTDALMAVTGGTAGVAGYALGAGVKTGVKAGIKYLLTNMKKEQDLLMNQHSWEDETFTIQ